MLVRSMSPNTQLLKQKSHNSSPIRDFTGTHLGPVNLAPGCYEWREIFGEIDNGSIEGGGEFQSQLVKKPRALILL